MKKKKLKSLILNKDSISKLDQAKMGGNYPAYTCEGPCQGGTTCCAGDGYCYTKGGPSCGLICTGPTYTDPRVCSKVW